MKAADGRRAESAEGLQQLRIRRDAIQAAILGRVNSDLLSPERVKAMTREMERYYADRMKEQECRSAEAPLELGRDREGRR